MNKRLEKLNSSGAKAIRFGDLTEKPNKVVLRYQQDEEDYAAIISPLSLLGQLAIDIDSKLIYWSYVYRDEFFLFVSMTKEETLTAIECAVLKRFFSDGISSHMRFAPRRGTNHHCNLIFCMPSVTNLTYMQKGRNCFNCSDFSPSRRSTVRRKGKRKKRETTNACRSSFLYTVFHKCIRFGPVHDHTCEHSNN